MRVGTASIRRRAQLLVLEPALSIEPLRGNIDTRLRKRRERGLDAVVLAACGLDRLGLGAEIGRRFDADELLPEAGQGALALQVRAGEEHLVAAADDLETRRRVEAERSCVAAIGGGCLAPVAAYHDGDRLTALVAAEDGAWVERRSGDDPAVLAAELLASSRLKVLVTRPREQADSLVAALAAEGFEVVLLPLIAVEPVSEDPIDVDGYDWVVVTSANGARELARRATAQPASVAAIGPSDRQRRSSTPACAPTSSPACTPRRVSSRCWGNGPSHAFRRCGGRPQPPRRGARRRLHRRLPHDRAAP